MSGSTERTRLVKLCDKDDLYSQTGHPLTKTYYDYDRDGKIAYTMREFYFCRDVTMSMGVPMRCTTRDEYKIIVSEEVFGEDCLGVEVPRVILYEKDQEGVVQRVVEAAIDADTKAYFPIHYFIGYNKAWPKRKGLVTRVRHLEPDGSFCHEYQYEYDDLGNRIRTYSLTRPDGPREVISNVIIEYDNYDNPIRYNNGHEYAIDNSYDQDGYRISAVIREKSLVTGQWDVICRHSYSYEQFELSLKDET